MLPDMDGLTICQNVRKLSDIPIIMLTAKDEINDKVTGLDIGADDYITKPFAIQELLARYVLPFASIIILLLNLQKNLLCSNLKNIHVYLDRHEVKVHNQLVELTKKRI